LGREQVIRLHGFVFDRVGRSRHTFHLPSTFCLHARPSGCDRIDVGPDIERQHWRLERWKVPPPAALPFKPASPSLTTLRLRRQSNLASSLLPESYIG